MTNRDLYERAKARIESSDRLRPYMRWLLNDIEYATDDRCHWVLGEDEESLEWVGETCKVASECLAAS
jgi:hypothetical protein